MKKYLTRGHVVIENVAPEVDHGLRRAKTVVGEDFEVSADIFRDGPGVLGAAIRFKGPGGRWTYAPMRHIDNDCWSGRFQPTDIGVWSYTIEAWTDRFGTWKRDLRKRVAADQDVGLELEEGALILDAAARAVPSKLRKTVADVIAALRSDAPQPDKVETVLGDELSDLLGRYPDRSGSTVYRPVLEVTVDRERARAGSWYEFFPRSTGEAGEHGTFKTATKRLPQIAAMGFDVVYLPPIHPIGETNRKGKNNSLDPAPDDVGSPWAIGSKDGGHTAVHPQLGTLKDFDDFVAAAEAAGLEVCLDFAIQCSPDHPWVSEHPDWFYQLPDGSIRYAENPPKKYQDIYPINFDTEDREGLWTELRGVLQHWIDHGVKIFRVDNPHTKSLPFWEWVIDDLKAKYPELIFLAEAFTRPKVMNGLAKLGFTQSYTYFTWRNTKWELTEYLTELTRTDMANYFRPNFFANTPDILHEYLQRGGPPAFKIRLVLAAFLSPTYGIYSGYELFENVPVHEGSEEYLNSEKYELKERDWSRSDSLAPYITAVNDIRRKHPALGELTNLTFHEVDKDNLIAFSKSNGDGDTILVVVNLNPFAPEEGTTSLDLDALGADLGQPFRVHDLITDDVYVWRGPHSYVRLDPAHEPAHIFEITT